MDSKFKGNAVVIGGSTFFYVEKNSTQKKVIIFLHGFPGNHQGLMDLANHIGQDDWRIIIPDLPACGYSAKLSKKHTLKNYSQWLEEFFKILSIKEATVIGHSFGAGVALAFASAHPKNVSSLILLNPVIKVGGLFNRMVSLYYQLAGKVPRYLQKIVYSNGFGKTMGDMIIFESADAAIHHQIIARDILEIKKITPKVTIELFTDFRKVNLIPIAKTIQAPSLIIAGLLDKISPAASIQELATQFNHATLEIMKNAGHLVPLEKPQDTATLIKKWLERQ